MRFAFSTILHLCHLCRFIDTLFFLLFYAYSSSLFFLACPTLFPPRRPLQCVFFLFLSICVSVSYTVTGENRTNRRRRKMHGAMNTVFVLWLHTVWVGGFNSIVLLFLFSFFLCFVFLVVGTIWLAGFCCIESMLLFSSFYVSHLTVAPWHWFSFFASRIDGYSFLIDWLMNMTLMWCVYIYIWLFPSLLFSSAESLISIVTFICSSMLLCSRRFAISEFQPSRLAYHSPRCFMELHSVQRIAIILTASFFTLAALLALLYGTF